MSKCVSGRVESRCVCSRALRALPSEESDCAAQRFKSGGASPRIKCLKFDRRVGLVVLFFLFLPGQGCTNFEIVLQINVSDLQVWYSKLGFGEEPSTYFQNKGTVQVSIDPDRLLTDLLLGRQDNFA